MSSQVPNAAEKHYILPDTNYDFARIIKQRDDLREALSDVLGWMQQHHPEAYANCPKAQAALASVEAL